MCCRTFKYSSRRGITRNEITGCPIGWKIFSSWNTWGLIVPFDLFISSSLCGTGYVRSWRRCTSVFHLFSSVLDISGQLRTLKLSYWFWCVGCATTSRSSISSSYRNVNRLIKCWKSLRLVKKFTYSRDRCETYEHFFSLSWRLKKMKD